MSLANNLFYTSDYFTNEPLVEAPGGKFPFIEGLDVEFPQGLNIHTTTTGVVKSSTYGDYRDKLPLKASELLIDFDGVKKRGVDILFQETGVPTPVDDLVLKSNTELLLELDTYPDGTRKNQLPTADNAVEKRKEVYRTYQSLLERAGRVKSQNPSLSLEYLQDARIYLLTHAPELYMVLENQVPSTSMNTPVPIENIPVPPLENPEVPNVPVPPPLIEEVKKPEKVPKARLVKEKKSNTEEKKGPKSMMDELREQVKAPKLKKTSKVEQKEDDEKQAMDIIFTEYNPTLNYKVKDDKIQIQGIRKGFSNIRDVAELLLLLKEGRTIQTKGINNLIVSLSKINATNEVERRIINELRQRLQN